MPKYQIKDNETGKTVTIQGDHAPSEQEAQQIFSDAGLRPKTHSEAGANIGQLVGNLAGTPFGKPGRVIAGTLGRVGGEVVQQAVSPQTSSIGDATKILVGLLQGKKINEQILSPEEQKNAMRKISSQQAGENLKNLGKEAAIGAGSELATEYVVAPILSKVLSAGKTITNPGKVLARARNAAAEAQSATTISGDAFTEAINSEVKKMGTKTAQKAGEDLLSSVQGKTFTPADLLDKLDFWNTAYTASGRIGKTEESRIMGALARTAKDQLSEVAPEALKFQNYLAMSHTIPKAIRKALWLATLGKVATGGGGI